MAAILAVLLIFVTYLWLTARSDLQKVTAEFRGDVSTYGAELARVCTLTATTTATTRRECENLLEGFSDILLDYGKAIITTPTTTSGTSSLNSTGTVPITPTTSTGTVPQ